MFVGRKDLFLCKEGASPVKGKIKDREKEKEKKKKTLNASPPSKK